MDGVIVRSCAGAQGAPHRGLSRVVALLAVVQVFDVPIAGMLAVPMAKLVIPFDRSCIKRSDRMPGHVRPRTILRAAQWIQPGRCHPSREVLSDGRPQIELGHSLVSIDRDSQSRHASCSIDVRFLDRTVFGSGRLARRSVLARKVKEAPAVALCSAVTPPVVFTVSLVG